MVNCREDPQLRCTPKTYIVHTLSLYLSTYTLSLSISLHTHPLSLSLHIHTISLSLYLSTYAPPLSVFLQSTYTLSLCLYILSLSLSLSLSIYLSQYVRTFSFLSIHTFSVTLLLHSTHSLYFSAEIPTLCTHSLSLSKHSLYRSLYTNSLSLSLHTLLLSITLHTPSLYLYTHTHCLSVSLLHFRFFIFAVAFGVLAFFVYDVKDRQ